MNGKSVYKTKQKELILDFLHSNSDRHVTVAEICNHIRSSGGSIGVTTIYRYLDKLLDEGVVQKIVTDGEAACFQYTGGDTCPEHAHFHLKCLQCGTLIHMKCGLIATLSGHIKEEHDFEIEPIKTTFYGKCGVCAKSNA